jgi:acetate---CoA ligase (ADP-forming)
VNHAVLAPTIRRMFSAERVAVIGAQEGNARSDAAVLPMLEAGTEMVLVNQRGGHAYGSALLTHLTDASRPIDVVLNLVRAELAVEAVEEAAEVGAAGAVVLAGGFAESGPAGALLQQRLLDSAARAGMGLVGPNSLGFVNPRAGVYAFGAPTPRLRPGRVAVISQSGALLRPVMNLGSLHDMGFSLLVSCGNEAQLDLVDFLGHCVADDDTDVILMVVEQIRRPAGFLRAAEEAAARGKPVIALTLGRTGQARRIAQSHTGALVPPSRATQAALDRVGVHVVDTIDGLVEAAVIFAHVPRTRWFGVNGLAVLSGSGGAAAMVSDRATAAGIPLPSLDDLQPDIAPLVPGVNAVNPLDMTGFVMNRADVFGAIFDRVSASQEVDGLSLIWALSPADAAFARPIVEAVAAKSSETDKPVLLCTVETAPLGHWSAAVGDKPVAIINGIRPLLSGLAAMRSFMARQARDAGQVTCSPAAPISRLGQDVTPGGFLRFGAAMLLLEQAGVQVAPYMLVPATGALASPPFAGPYVVKLADVPHRTELGAVFSGVTLDDLPRILARLRDIATDSGCSGAVAIQPLVGHDGEAFIYDGQAFIGVESSIYGPVVAVGPGGVRVELAEVAARLAPLRTSDIEDLLDQLAPTRVFEGWRGSRSWDRAALADIVGRVARLATASSEWMASLDINPLLHTDSGFVAVDCLCYVTGPDNPETERP